MSLFILATSLRKSVPGGPASGMMQGYRRCSNEDEARGSFMRSIEKEKPGYSIECMLVMEVPELPDGAAK